jgi:hypothetical protein
MVSIEDLTFPFESYIYIAGGDRFKVGRYAERHPDSFQRMSEYFPDRAAGISVQSALMYVFEKVIATSNSPRYNICMAYSIDEKGVQSGQGNE